MRSLTTPWIPALVTFVAALTTSSAQLSVGSTSDDVEFSLFGAGSQANSKLSAFGDQITVLYYFAPW